MKLYQLKELHMNQFLVSWSSGFLVKDLHVTRKLILGKCSKNGHHKRFSILWQLTSLHYNVSRLDNINLFFFCKLFDSNIKKSGEFLSNLNIFKLSVVTTKNLKYWGNMVSLCFVSMGYLNNCFFFFSGHNMLIHFLCVV